MTDAYILWFLIALICTIGISAIGVGWLGQRFVDNFNSGQHWDKDNTRLCVMLENLALFIGAVCLVVCMFTYRFYFIYIHTF